MSFASLLAQAFEKWNRDKASTLGAALAYYASLSLAPLLVAFLSLVDVCCHDQFDSSALGGALEKVMGPAARSAIEELIRAAHSPTEGAIATTISIVAALIGAGAMFAQLQDSMNTIWDVEPKPGRTMWDTLKMRAVPFLMILAACGLLLVSLLANAAINAIGTYASATFGGTQWLHIFDAAASFLIITVVFALIFKYVPDAQVSWRDVWHGAALTSLLFVIGKFLLGLYLGKTGVASAYGAAGSLAIILIWVYYSAQILFYGAELTHCYARQCHVIVPAQHAVARHA